MTPWSSQNHKRLRPDKTVPRRGIRNEQCKNPISEHSLSHKRNSPCSPVVPVTDRSTWINANYDDDDVERSRSFANILRDLLHCRFQAMTQFCPTRCCYCSTIASTPWLQPDPDSNHVRAFRCLGQNHLCWKNPTLTCLENKPHPESSEWVVACLPDDDVQR